MSKPRLIAFYLPQFYPTKENDEWWQKGFTEWTNVGNAKPLFRGHYQPRVPADLGYYDLRVPDVREQQAELAREAGIEGFCYWHYWFAGRRLLDRVFREVVESGKPDYPFCLCWANHSWYRKTWDPTKLDELLIEQTYPGVQDYIDHFNAMLPAFKDKRYMKVHGRLVFGIFSPLNIPDFRLFKETWNELAKANGLEGFFFWGFTFVPERLPIILNNGFDGVVKDDILNFRDNQMSIWNKTKIKVFHRPKVLTYNAYINYTLDNLCTQENVFPCINPNFDHSPRSGANGVVIIDHSPEKWEFLCKNVFGKCSNRSPEGNLVFIKAWNEWGEGNYLEPDLRFGKRFIKATKDAYNEIE